MRKKLLFIFLPLFALLLLAEFALPLLIEGKLKEVAKEKFALSVSFDKLHLSPTTMTAGIDNLVVKDANSNELLLSNKKLSINISLASIIKLQPVVNSIQIDSPYINIERYADGKLNFDKYIPKNNTPTKESGKSYFDIKTLIINDGCVHIKDNSTNTDENIKNINLSAMNISNQESKTDTSLDANLSLEAFGAKLAILSKSKPFRKNSEFITNLKLSKLELQKFARFIPKEVNHLSGEFFCDLHSNLTIDKTTKLISSGELGIHNLSCVSGAKSINSAKTVLSINSLSANNLNDIKNILLHIKDITLKNSDLHLSDSSKAEILSISISNSAIKLSNISNREQKLATGIDAKINLTNDSSLAVLGEADIFKKSLKLDIDAKKISILPIRALGVLPPRVNIANGYFYTKGQLDSSFENNKSNLKYNGNAMLEKLVVLDKKTQKQALSFDNLNVNGIDFDTIKDRVKIATINLDGPRGDILINKQSQSNISLLLEDNASAKTDDKNSSASQKPFGVGIGAIVIQNGAVSFLDEHVEPKFKANLTRLSGRVSSLRLNKNKQSKIELIGRFNNQGEINIKGILVPNQKNFYLNLKSDIKNISMPSFGTYSSKYIGHEIDSGSLGLELDYNIIGKDLTLNNKISLFGFNLGREVESPDAVHLPYNLAIAILKDSNDNIHIELPVEGKTDDPQVRSGKVIWKFVSQLIGKIIASPFKFIGSMFGGDDIGAIEFDYGQSILTAIQKDKITKIAEALKQKTKLSVEIESFVDGENDTAALIEREFKRKLAIQKLKDTKKPLDKWQDVQIEPAEYEKYLQKAYKAETFAKATNAIGMEKSVPSDEMKNLIMTHIEISEQNLLALAKSRAEAVRSTLVASGVELSRISIANTKPTGASSKEGIKNSRVEIKLSMKQ